MKPITPLDTIVLSLITIHFGVPLIYYYYLRRKWLPKKWDVKVDHNYKPKITIIVPTYNEARLIEKKLENIYNQDYPRNQLEIIVIDSASTDETPEKVKQWAMRHPDVNLKLIQEPERKGKAHALNTALKHATGEIVIITDVDALWPNSNNLTETMKWLADPKVGAVSCLKKPATPGKAGIEEGYRQYYNTLRLAESKAYSTPVFHGELAAFKRVLLDKLGGFPTDIGADDSHTATKISIMGYRTITPDDIWCEELVPNKDYGKWRVRRAQHLIQHFMIILRNIPKSPGIFRNILAIESYLHLINPWILLATLALLMYNAFSMASVASVLLLGLGIALFIILRSFRVWTVTQLYLVLSFIRNLYTREIIWQKEAKSM